MPFGKLKELRAVTAGLTGMEELQAANQTAKIEASELEKVKARQKALEDRLMEVERRVDELHVYVGAPRLRGLSTDDQPGLSGSHRDHA